MEIKGFIEISLVDWDGKVSSVVFLAGCNMRCPFCYNATLVLRPHEMQTIPFEHVKKRLKKSREWIDGVVVTGGEPTIHSELPELCRKIKALGLEVKVDTNGTNPHMIEEMVNDQLANYIAMDLKAPLIPKNYSEASGIEAGRFLRDVKHTLDFLMTDKIEYEFRTTLVPTLHTRQDIVKICDRIRNCNKYVLQNFRSNVETVNPSFKDLKPFSQKEITLILEEAKTLVPNAELRG